MRFLKAHAFMLALAVVVVVVGGAMMGMKFVAGGDIDELMAKRASLSAKLKKLKSKPVVNQAILDATRRRIQQSRAAAMDALKENLLWNRDEHKVLQLVYNDDTGWTTMPAFPIQRQKYDDYGLVYEFTEEYQKALSGMLAELKATQAPTNQEISDEQDRLARRLSSLQAAEERRKLTASSGAELPGPAVSPSRTPSAGAMYNKPNPMDVFRKGPMTGGSMGRSAGSGRSAWSGGKVSAGIVAEADAKGLASIRLKKAKAGEVFADMNSFDPVFTSATTNASDTQLWQAQINLWVTEEIIRAIHDTNTRILSKLPAGDRNVLASPVKRLVSINIDRDYYTKTAGAAAGSTSPTKGKGFMFGGGKDQFLSKQGRGGGMPMPSARMGKKARTGTSKSDLTKRVCNTQYDVIHYQFTVIMSMRHVQELQYSLLSHNNHTILNVNMAQAIPLGGGRNSRDGEGAYYYGTDPVLEVTMSCEMLFRTAWERGTYDPKTKKWSSKLPPLMPVEVLKNLSDLLPNAMRLEDRARLSKRA